MLRYLLEPFGFCVYSAHDGLGGLRRVEERAYDIIFLDVHMPKMRGPELLKIIKEVRPAQLVVMMNSGSEPQQAMESMAPNSGALAWLHKPFEIDQVLQFIQYADKARRS